MADYADLMHRLVSAQIGACSCMTKTPDIQHHSPICRYRLYAEAVSAILTLQEKLIKLESRQ